MFFVLLKVVWKWKFCRHLWCKVTHFLKPCKFVKIHLGKDQMHFSRSHESIAVVIWLKGQKYITSFSTNPLSAQHSYIGLNEINKEFPIYVKTWGVRFPICPWYKIGYTCFISSGKTLLTLGFIGPPKVKNFVCLKHWKYLIFLDRISEIDLPTQSIYNWI